jgi:triacylglycerol lipase
MTSPFDGAPIVDSDLPESIAEILDPLVPDEVEHASFVPTPPGSGPPTRRWWGRHVREVRWTWELAALTADPVFYGAGVPHGDGGPVVLIPGFLAGDPSLAVLGNFLRRINHRPYGAGIVVNVDCSDRAVDRIERRIEVIAASSERRVALVGHSRGGHFAKALGHRRPDLVRQVISMGAGLDTPFDISIPTKAAVAGVRRVLRASSRKARQAGCLTDTCSCPFTRDYSAPFPPDVPVTSIYTRRDGVVWWEACVVPWARNVEVRGSHIGLAFNRHAYRVIARQLAADGAVVDDR